MARLGLQLYTVRDVFNDDPLGVIRQVGTMGYEGVEFPGGMMEKATAVELRRTVAESGLAVAGIVFEWKDFTGRLEQAIAYAKELGAPAVIFPWIPAELRPDATGWQAVARKFNDFARRCRQEGLLFLYHPHGYEFGDVEGHSGFDWLIEALDTSLVGLEIDVYWLEHGGMDAVEFTRRYANLAPFYHFKDMKDRQSQRDTEVGAGYIDMLAVARLGLQAQAQWFIVEQEAFDMPSLESAQISLRNLRRIVQQAVG